MFRIQYQDIRRRSGKSIRKFVIWLVCGGEVKENSPTGTTKISSNPINFDAPQLLARWSTHPILLKNILNHIITSGICLSYSVSHEKYKHRENQKLRFFRFFRNFRLILHGNEKNPISPNFVQKTGFLYFDAPELFEKSSKIKNFFFWRNFKPKWNQIWNMIPLSLIVWNLLKICRKKKRFSKFSAAG